MITILKSETFLSGLRFKLSVPHHVGKQLPHRPGDSQRLPVNEAQQHTIWKKSQINPEMWIFFVKIVHELGNQQHNRSVWLSSFPLKSSLICVFCDGHHRALFVMVVVSKTEELKLMSRNQPEYVELKTTLGSRKFGRGSISLDFIYPQNHSVFKCLNFKN